MQEGLSELWKEVYEINVSKGFWDNPRSVLESIALMHSELSEAIEAYRDEVDDSYIDVNGGPEGMYVELADCLIRILDFFGSRQHTFPLLSSDLRHIARTLEHLECANSWLDASNPFENNRIALNEITIDWLESILDKNLEHLKRRYGY